MHIENKKAHFDYEILDTLETGIELTGAETKSFFENRVIITGAFVRVVNGQLYLVNAKFTLKLVPEEKQSRMRRLLVHKAELITWGSKIAEKKLTIVPLSMYTRGRFIKLKIGLARSKQAFNKKAKKKKHDIEREVERDYRTKLT